MIKSNWYSSIELNIRPFVMLLRNNGFNTTCSYGHEMCIEGEIILDGEIQRLHNLLYCYFDKQNREPRYKITVIIEVIQGIIFQKSFILEIGGKVLTKPNPVSAVKKGR